MTRGFCWLASSNEQQVPHPLKRRGFGMTCVEWGKEWCWLARGIEERFLGCAGRQLRRSEAEEKASARSGRNDRSGLFVLGG